jgi:hypothetical protein
MRCFRTAVRPSAVQGHLQYVVCVCSHGRRAAAHSPTHALLRHGTKNRIAAPFLSFAFQASRSAMDSCSDWSCMHYIRTLCIKGNCESTIWYCVHSSSSTMFSTQFIYLTVQHSYRIFREWLMARDLQQREASSLAIMQSARISGLHRITPC